MVGHYIPKRVAGLLELSQRGETGLHSCDLKFSPTVREGFPHLMYDAQKYIGLGKSKDENIIG
jgi:hypothetical protein